MFRCLSPLSERLKCVTPSMRFHTCPLTKGRTLCIFIICLNIYRLAYVYIYIFLVVYCKSFVKKFVFNIIEKTQTIDIIITFFF